MPFLFPALASAACDMLILYLSGQQHAPNTNGSIGEDDLESFLVYRVQYLVPLAVMRLVLLFFPLPYHSYTGTAVKFPIFYQILYGGTLLIVLLHMLCLSMLDPDSLSTFLPSSHISVRRILQSISSYHRELVLESRELSWWMLVLSIISVICHLVMFGHVRSTAPPAEWISSSKRQQKKRLMFYYASRRNILEEEKKSQETDQLVYPSPSRNHCPVNGMGTVVGPAASALPSSPGITIRSISSQYDEFVMEMQSRIQTAKKEWSKRLEDFTNRLTPTDPPTLNLSPSGSPRCYQNNTNTPMRSSLQNPLIPLTPFRVLLQLFAYEDVLDNGKLDAVFDMDGGEAMTFFVPQLLSFLLHGAYHCSNKLEEWILQKCGRNIHFAHHCFWFLRSWCLEIPATALPKDIEMGFLGVSQSNSSSNASINASSDEAQLGFSGQSYKDLLQYPGGAGAGSSSPRHSRNNSRNSIDLIQNPNSQKFLPEERAMIEGLILKVIQHAELPSRLLQFGNGRASSDKFGDENILDHDVSQRQHFNGFHDDSFNSVLPGNDDDISESSLTPELVQSLPIDPYSGFPSQKHLESALSKRKFGFLPLDESGHPDVNGDDWFQKTPRFLDALISLADGLFLAPRENRKMELKKKLQSLEIEFLPSNSIYLPIGNAHHRVWRIVPEESIALSTKERVPCIVCLEVVNYSVKETKMEHQQHQRQPSNTRSFASRPRGLLEIPQIQLPPIPQLRQRTLSGENSDENIEFPNLTFLIPNQAGSSEKDVVNSWRFSDRDPHRRDKFIDKVANSMIDRINKMHLERVMKDGLNRIRDFRDRKRIHELLCSKFPDMEEDESEFHHSLDLANYAQDDFSLNDGMSTPPRSDSPPPAHSLSSDVKSDSSASKILDSMGQWTSPTPSSKEIKVVVKNQIERDETPKESERTDRSLVYGSTHERRRARDPTRPPRPVDTSKQPKDICTKAPPVVFRENWQAKEDRLRSKSAYGRHPGWRLLPILIKANDDLRQEQLASQIIYRMAFILARERVRVWLCPYEILAITDRGGIIEAIPDTISLDSLKRNDPNFTTLHNFFVSFFGEDSDDLADAKANFVESLAAYSIVCYLLQIKDRHNGNILLDNRGHLIHIDWGFFFLSSPGKNSGFESAPFKLTRDFVEVMGGPDSHLFRTFRELCVRSFITLRRHCMEIILLVEMLKTGNEDLKCFRGRPDDAIKGLRERFRLDLSDRACKEYVNSLVDESLENWRTNWYDRYQRYCVGVL